VPRLSLVDGAEAFDVTVLEAAAPSRVVLFGVGRGGDPERHLLARMANLADAPDLVGGER
jgi:hypothetical protein